MIRCLSSKETFGRPSSKCENSTKTITKK